MTLIELSELTATEHAPWRVREATLIADSAVARANRLVTPGAPVILIVHEILALAKASGLLIHVETIRQSTSVTDAAALSNRMATQYAVLEKPGWLHMSMIGRVVW